MEFTTVRHAIALEVSGNFGPPMDAAVDADGYPPLLVYRALTKEQRAEVDRGGDIVAKNC